MDAKKLKLIVKGENKPTFGTDPNEPWSVRAGITEGETGMLHAYLKSRGINPDFVSKDTKISHAKSTEFHKWKRDHMFDDPINYVSTTAAEKMKKLRAQTEEVELEEMKTLKLTPVEMRQKALNRAKRLTSVITHNGLHKEETDKTDTITVDIPLMIRLLEYAREDAKTDMDLHSVTERLIEIRGKGMLTMADYDYVATGKHKVKEEAEQIDEKNVPTSPEKWARAKAAAKSKFAVYPSAYANAWASKKYKSMGGGWRATKEEVEHLDELAPSTLASYVLKTTSKDPKRAEPRKKAMSKLAKAMAKQPADPNAPRYSTNIGEGFDDHEEIAKELIRRHGMNVTKDHLKALENERDSRGALDHDAVMAKVRAMGAMTEAKKPTALEKFRQAAAEREKKHAEIEKKQSKDGSGMTSAIDRLEKHLNKEEILDELNYDTVKSLYNKRRDDFHGDQIGKKKKGKEVSAKNVSRSISRLMGFKPTQKEEVEQITEDNLDSIAKKHGMEFKKSTYGATMKHPTKGEISINRYGEWRHWPAGSNSSKAHGDSSDNFSSLSKHLSSLKEATDDSWLHPNKVTVRMRKSAAKMKEDVYHDTLAATQMPFDMANQADDREPTYSKKKEMSKSARMIKALYKKHKMVKEELYDHEKEDKSVATYGKKPKVEKQEAAYGDDDNQAAMILKGGKTLTGQTRDTLEIDPVMRKPMRPDNGINNKKTDK